MGIYEEGLFDFNGRPIRNGDPVTINGNRGQISLKRGPNDLTVAEVWFMNDVIEKYDKDYIAANCVVEKVIRPACGHYSFGYDLSTREVKCAMPGCECTEPVFDDRFNAKQS